MIHKGQERRRPARALDCREFMEQVHLPSCVSTPFGMSRFVLSASADGLTCSAKNQVRLPAAARAALLLGPMMANK